MMSSVAKRVAVAAGSQKAALERIVAIAKELVEAEKALLSALEPPNEGASPEDWSDGVLRRIEGSGGHAEMTPGTAVLEAAQSLLTYF